MSAPTMKAQALIEKALRRAFELGQTYWRAAEPGESWSEKANETRDQFESLVSEVRTPAELSDEQIDRIAENCAKAMPDGIRGFCVTWGWRQFARELLDVCAGHVRAASAPPVAPAEWSHSNIESPFNACMYREYCLGLKLAAAEGPGDAPAESVSYTGFVAPLGQSNPMFTHAAALAASAPSVVPAEPVAWRVKERINGEFDSDWCLLSHEPPTSPRTIAIEPLYAAAPPAPAVAPPEPAAMPTEVAAWDRIASAIEARRSRDER